MKEITLGGRQYEDEGKEREIKKYEGTEGRKS